MADIICRSCGGRFHETTNKYNSDVRATGDMFKLKELYRRMAWTSFNEHRDAPAGELVCPECEGPYCNGAGMIRVDGEEKAPAIKAEPAGIEAQVVLMHSQGMSSPEIARELGLGHYMKVVNILRKQGLK